MDHPEDSGGSPDSDGSASAIRGARGGVRLHSGGYDAGAAPKAGNLGESDVLLVQDNGREVSQDYGPVHTWVLHCE